MGVFDWFIRNMGGIQNPPEKQSDDKEQTYQDEDVHYYFDSVYQYVIFSDYVDIDRVIGRTSGCYTHELTAQYMYINNLWRCSKQLISTDYITIKNFFEAVEKLEDLLINCPYNIYRYNQLYELKEYQRRKEQIIIDFINRSFMHCFRHSLELKTVKGRVNHVENWFMQMEYYKMFMTEKEKYIIDNLYMTWISEYKAIAEKN